MRIDADTFSNKETQIETTNCFQRIYEGVIVLVRDGADEKNLLSTVHSIYNDI